MSATYTKGFLRMTCPVRSCKFVKDFTETNYTVKHPEETRKTREAYLYATHAVGLHRRVRS